MTFDPMYVEVTCVTLPKDHCVQVPWQYINVCGYSDQFCKIPHTYTYIHTHTYYIQNEWSHSLLLNSVQTRQKSNVQESKWTPSIRAVNVTPITESILTMILVKCRVGILRGPPSMIPLALTKPSSSTHFTEPLSWLNHESLSWFLALTPTRI